jgi:hypothetical protein
MVLVWVPVLTHLVVVGPLGLVLEHLIGLLDLYKLLLSIWICTINIWVRFFGFLHVRTRACE